MSVGRGKCVALSHLIHHCYSVCSEFVLSALLLDFLGTPHMCHKHIFIH